MLIIKHTVETRASPEAIWEIWQDVTNWKTWDHGIEFSTIEGPFQTGTTGTLKPIGGPLVHTKLTLVEPKKRFVDEAQLTLARIIVSHFLTESEGKTHVTHQIEMTGPLAFFFAIVIGRNMKKNLPQEMAAMIKKAESLNFQKEI
ncbi:MAG: SRPBCC family protein [Parachlamydiaceae bacterium]|nr:SRPBCC family protein [Parachlamydiaceae bacterium]